MEPAEDLLSFFILQKPAKCVFTYMNNLNNMVIITNFKTIKINHVYLRL